jgi:hypothetical protein
MNPDGTFEIESVVHLVSPTGVRARTLSELRAAVAEAPERSIFWHVAGGQRREPWSEELPPDDFSAWVGGVVQDRETAEKLSFAVQNRRAAPATLRAGLLETMNGVRGGRADREAPEGGEFALLTCESVTVPTGLAACDPATLADALARADAGAWFYHLVEQPWLGGAPLLFDWLRARDAARLAAWLEELAHSGLPLETMRRRLFQRRRRSAIPRRLSEAAASPEAERRDAARDAVEGLVRRLRRPGDPP